MLVGQKHSVTREATMWEVRLDAFGGPEELHLVEVPDPVAGRGQVIVRTAAAGITFVETQVRAGRPPWPGPGPALPVVLGNGVEGEVIGVGEEADPSWLGRRGAGATGRLGGGAHPPGRGVPAPLPAPPRGG